ncbi:PolC-type DNA polymerase III [Mycoplasmatota bacterium]|nr:PolC-type DNA polymerase III [Mycoplasmatota bacterium]
MKLNELLDMINIEEKDFFLDGRIDEILVDINKNKWIFIFDLPKVLPIELYIDFKQKLEERFSSYNQIESEINYRNQRVPKEYVDDYYSYAYIETLEDYPRVSVLDNYHVRIDEIITFEVSSKEDESIILDKLDLINTKLASFGVKISFDIVFTDEVVSTKDIINNEHNKLEQKLATELEDSIKSKKLSIGDSIKGNFMNIEDIPKTDEEVSQYARDLIVVEGYVFKSSMRKLKRGSTLLEALITNFNDSIKIKKIIRERDDQLIDQHLKIIEEGNWVKCSGYFNFDKYAKDVVFDFTNISTIDKKKEIEILDDAEEKRIELHAHTKMSSMDGIASVKDIVKKAIKWGHKAIAITDHNTVQSFPDFNYATKNTDIKPIYGVELSYIDDLDTVITRNESEVKLRDADVTFVVFDIETTGFSVNHDEIIEIAAIKIENGHFTHFNSFVKANRKLSKLTTKLTSITDEDLLDAPSIEEVMIKFHEFIRGSILVAHNADFDMAFIYENFRKLNIYTVDYPTIDTLQLARVLYKDTLKSFNLKAVSKHLKVSLEQHHRAIHDTEATANILLIMLNEVFNKGIIYHCDMNNLITPDIVHSLNIPRHITILAQNRTGLKNMYKILSDAATNHFHREPRALRSIIERHREGVLIGSSCVKGEVFEFSLNKDFESLRDKASFYDYLEIQPPSVYSHLFEDIEGGDEYIKDAISRIVTAGEHLDIPVVATGDVHHIYPNQVDYRKIYLKTPMVGGGYHPLNRVENVPSMHLRTTNQMLEDFSFLGDKALDIVVKNSNLINDKIERFDLFPKELFTPNDDFFASKGIPSISEEVEKMVWTNAKRKYGTNLPDVVKERIEHELDPIINRGFGNVYYISHILVKNSLENKYLVGSRGSVGSSLVATLMNITEVNPLPPHYVCPKCQFSIFKTMDENIDSRTSIYQEDLRSVESGFDLPLANCPVCGTRFSSDGHDIPFATFLGFKGDKVPDIDLNFSGDYQAQAHLDIRKMFGEDYAFRAGTISTIQEKTAYGYVKGHAKDLGIQIRDAEVQRLVSEIHGVRRSTGQHPGGIVVVPHDIEIYDITPIQYPADDVNSTWRTSHFDYHSFESNLFKIDVLGHDNPTVIRQLMDYVEMFPSEFPFDNVYDIPMVDKKVMSLFSSTDALKLSGDIMSSVGTYGLPELGTNFVRQMLVDTKPKNFAELVKISGLSHGTDVWLNNAKDLVQEKHPEFGKINFSDVIGCRDDIMINLIYQGLDPEDAYDITETARKTGKYLSFEQKQLMKEKNIPDWYIWSCDQIKYMFPKAHATAYVIEALRIAWFKVHRPIYYYATYFSRRADYFDVNAFLGGYDGIRDRILEIKDQLNPSDKDQRLVTVLEIALEMCSRGYTFNNIDLNKSKSSEFIISDDKKTLILPFVTIDGLGTNVADSVVSARNNSEFKSIEDLRKRTRLSKTLIQKLKDLKVLDELEEKDEGNQLSLF